MSPCYRVRCVFRRGLSSPEGGLDGGTSFRWLDDKGGMSPVPKR